MIDTIQDAEKRAEALRELGKALTAVDQCEQVMQLIQQSWLQVETRENAMHLLSLVAELIPLQPTLDRALRPLDEFRWARVKTMMSSADTTKTSISIGCTKNL